MARKVSEETDLYLELLSSQQNMDKSLQMYIGVKKESNVLA
jgi:hypothetical protein